MGKLTKFLKKTWHFIWHEDSLLSWIVNIILAFVLIKFIVYPGLGLVLGTSHPIVAVVSSSMEHHQQFDEWWASRALCESGACNQGQFYAKYNVTKEDFQKYPFAKGFNIGDIMFLRKADPKSVKMGDIIVFRSPYRSDPIIHRVIKKWTDGNIYYFRTKGDNNAGHVQDELQITEAQLVGKTLFRVPYLGYVKIGFVKFLCVFGKFNFCVR
ncbi:MAG: signal peptidase I [Candidatus Woesearchaeota archaeon]|nr:signal peptidase I [Candidatus Woesearchaeota archaeon]